MFVEQFQATIAGARTMAQINALVPLLYSASSLARLSEAELGGLDGMIEARRRMVRDGAVPAPRPAGRPTLFPRRPSTPSPDRRASRTRSRRLAYTSPLPPGLSDRYHPGQLAILRIVGDECRDKGVCGLHVEAIAARAGVTRRYVQKVIRLAALDGLIVIQERPREGRKNDTNLIRIISGEWRQWLKRGPKRRPPPLDPIGRTGDRPTDTGVKSGDGRAVGLSGVAAPHSHGFPAGASAPAGKRQCESQTAVRRNRR